MTPTYVEPVVKHQLPERTRLQDIMCDLSKDVNPCDIVMRRIDAIDTMVALSRRQEVQCHKSQLSKSSSLSSLGQSPVPKEESPVPHTFPLICEKTQCIFCFGNGIKKTFCRPAKMMDHVESHLRLDSVACRWVSGSDDRARCGSRRASCRRALGTLSMRV